MLSNSNHHNPFHMKPSRHSIELANADITRLMDPSYHSYDRGVSSTEPARAYIDRRGQMHDPDFHYFPVYEGAGRNNSRRGRRISDHSERNSRSLFGYEQAELEEDEEEEIMDSRSRRRHGRHNTRQLRLSPTYLTSSSDSYYYPSSIPSSASSSPSSASSPLPLSPQTSVFDEKPKHHHHSLLPKKFRRHSSDSISSPYSFETVSDPLESDDDLSDAEDAQLQTLNTEERDLDISSQKQHTALSYSQTMKKQWLAVSLSLRFRLFRAKRRASSSRKFK